MLIDEPPFQAMKDLDSPSTGPDGQKVSQDDMRAAARKILTAAQEIANAEAMDDPTIRVYIVRATDKLGELFSRLRQKTEKAADVA